MLQNIIQLKWQNSVKAKLFGNYIKLSKYSSFIARYNNELRFGIIRLI